MSISCSIQLLYNIRWQIAYNIYSACNSQCDNPMVLNSIVRTAEDNLIIIKMCNAGLPENKRTEDIETILTYIPWNIDLNIFKNAITGEEIDGFPDIL